MFYFDDFYGQKVLKSDLLNEITAFFTTRSIGETTLEQSRKELENALRNLKPERILYPIQTHSDNVEFVDKREEYSNTDGMILQEKNTAVYLKFADCTPLIFYDKKQKTAAVSHAGWRGTAEKIGVKTIEKMNSDPQNIIALIGPAISLCCYEVSLEVRNKLLATVKNSEGLYLERNVDLKKINARQLEEIGVKNIDICPYCTSCNNNLFYSYRKENGTENRHFAVAML